MVTLGHIGFSLFTKPEYWSVVDKCDKAGNHVDLQTYFSIEKHSSNLRPMPTQNETKIYNVYMYIILD